MGRAFQATRGSLQQGVQHSSDQGEPAIVCFCCRACCTKYQVRLSLTEGQRIADELGLTFDEWLERYVDKYWQRPDSFLLRQRNGACVFLEQAEGSQKSLCLIHHVKPSACWLWTPSLYRNECQEGLAKYWHLTVGPSGQPEGSEEKLRDFGSFLNFLASSNEPEYR